MAQSVALLGTGRMGSALARAFVAAELHTTVWNRTAAKLAPLVEAGALPAASVLEAVQSAGVIVSNVLDYPCSAELLSQPEVAGALKGKCLVQLSSGTSRQARTMQAWAEANGTELLVGAIMSYPSGIGTPQGTIFYAGPQALYERLHPTLSALGGNPVHVGPQVGLVSALNSAVLAFLWSAGFGFLQGAAIAESEGVSVDQYWSTLKPLLPVVEASLGDAARRVEAKDFAGTEAALYAHEAALGHLLAHCRDAGLDTQIPQAFRQLVQAGVAAGHADDDFNALYPLMRHK